MLNVTGGVASDHRSPRFLLVGVPFSRNLGDRVIAECTNHMIRLLFPGAAVEFLDLSGRTSTLEDSTFRRQPVTDLFYRLPEQVRSAAVATILPPTLLIQHRRRWAAALRRVDAVLIGGGQLFQDVNLNFPIKLAFLDLLLRRSGRPFAIFAIGVDSRTSIIGRLLLRRMLLSRNLRAASCRDEASRHGMRSIARGAIALPSLAPDPALFSPELYEAAAPAEGSVGINITSPEELLTVGKDTELFGRARLDQMWRSLVAELVLSGRQVVLFSNGLVVDHYYASHLLAQLDSNLRDRVKFAPRPETVAELVQLTTRCATVVAHRLHSCILAATFGRKVVGLAWDSKVQGFFDVLREPEASLTAGDVSVNAILARIDQPVPRSRAINVRALQHQALESLRAALTSIVFSGAAPFDPPHR